MAYRNQDAWTNDNDYLTDLGLQIETKLREKDSNNRQPHLSKEISELIEEYEKGIISLRPLANHRSLSEKERGKRKTTLHELNNRLNQFKRSQTLDTNPFDVYESHSYSSGSGPGLGQRQSIDQVQEQQRNIIDEQDRGLEQISAALRRQQKMGHAIQEEVGEHNVIIDDINVGATRADARIRRETQRIEQTRHKEKTYCSCVLWIIIVVLAVVIIIIGVIPYHKN